jgi:ABC-type multidrug transport system fused ATPase/permease subunit
MSSLTAEDQEWMLKTNSQYMEMIKVVMNLATASLVLPLFFVKNFVAQTDSQPPSQSFHWQAYSSWISLLLSLLFGLIFCWASAKYVKVVSGGKEDSFLARYLFHKTIVRDHDWFENRRDASAAGTVVFFFAGVVFALLFFSGR